MDRLQGQASFSAVLCALWIALHSHALKDVKALKMSFRRQAMVVLLGATTLTLGHSNDHAFTNAAVEYLDA